MELCGYVAMRLFGYVAVWLYGFMDTWPGVEASRAPFWGPGRGLRGPISAPFRVSFRRPQDEAPGPLGRGPQGPHSRPLPGARTL